MDWDLSDFYASPADPQIEKDKKWIENKVKLFSKKYKGKINSRSVTPQLMLNALTDLEALETKWTHLGAYARLLKSKHTQDPKIASFAQYITEFSSNLSAQILWFNLEWKALPEKKAEKLLKSRLLKDHKHHLSVSRLFVPHTLTEPEEILLTKKSPTGVSAIIRLYDELLAREEFKIAGKKEVFTTNTISPVLTNDPDRKIRLKAAKAYTDTFSKNAKTYAFILNTKILDKKINDEIRNYNNMLEGTLLNYEVDKKVVKTLSESIAARYDICERFYLAKSKLLNTKLTEVDRYSGFLKAKQSRYSFSKARDLILESFYEFSPNFGSIASQFFEKNWIDSKPIKGKTSGAFCSYITPSLHPYILVNFTGLARDVETLAHELGHGIHAYLSRENNLFEFYPSTATAEIASVFGENILFENMYKETTSKTQKINMIGERTQGIFATVFRQNAFFLFEQELNESRRTKGELSVEEINALYQKHLQAMFGKGLTLSEGHEYWWAPIGHFFHYNFYVFTYSFGELLTHALYKKYKEEGVKFIKKYEKMLSLGGSLPPKELLKIVDVDITKPKFWDQGLNLIDEMVKEFEELIK